MKFVAPILALLVATAAGAGTVYQDREHTSTLIDVQMFPRMKLWPSNRHIQTADGRIMVCEVPQVEQYYATVCYQDGSKTKTAWIVLQDVVISGFVLKAYELRSNGTLIAYYSQTNMPAVKK